MRVLAKKNSAEYWEERIAADTWNQYNSLEDKNRALIEFYQDASKNIRNEFYTLAEKFSRNGVLSLSDMHKQNRLKRLNKNMEYIVEGLGRDVFNKTSAAMQKGFKGVYSNVRVELGDIEFAQPNKELMKKLLDKPWQGSNFSKRLWKNQSKLASTLNRVLLTGLQQGKTVTEIAVSLNSAMGQGFNAAHRLIRTETMHYLNDAALQGYKDTGIKYVQFWAAEDERTCPECSKYHGKIFPIDKAPILPLHPYCRCTYLPVTDKNAASAFIYEDTPVYYSPDNDYTVELEGYNPGINKGLSSAIEDVAKRGGKDGFEHMYLVDLQTGGLDYYETNHSSSSVGIDFWGFIRKNPDKKFAFIHNHNVVSSLSEADLTTPVTTPNITMQIAVQNNGVKYIAERTEDAIKGYYPDFYYEKELEPLNKLYRDGKITIAERMIQREQIITECLIRDFYKKGVVVIDGSKK